MDFLVSCLISVLFFVTLLYLLGSTRGKVSPLNTPPAPLSLPIFGNLFQLAFKKLHHSMTDLSKQYGDIFICDLLGLRYVVVNSASVAREALLTRKDDFAGRPRPLPYVGALVTGNGRDIVFSDFGPGLIKMRKIVHSALRMYGANLYSMEMKICEGVEELSETIKTKNGQPFDPEKDICLTVMNTVFAVLFQDRYDVNDPEFQKMVELNEFANAQCSPDNLINLLPWLRFLPLPSLKKLHEDIAYRDSVYRRKYLEHKESFNPDNIRDLTDALIKAFTQEGGALQNGDTGVVVKEEDLLLIMNDVFVAGFETLTTTLTWYFLYMIAYPDVQRKAQAEMDHVIGRDRLPGLKDRGCLPYIEAIIAEVLRVSSVFPVGVPHKAIRDTKLAGYDIPKGTGMFINIWALHHDEREWDEPFLFNPSRFLDHEGKYTGIGNRGFLPFGAGRRVCVGETLAKVELFLITSRLLHTFEFKSLTSPSDVDLEGVMRTTHSPKPFKLCGCPRLSEKN